MTRLRPLFLLVGLPSARSFAVGRLSRQRLPTRIAPGRRTHASTTSPRCAGSPNNEANALYPVDSLRQDYFALRHGQSMANVAGIIMSDPTVACTNYGLSEVGQQQATAAAHDVRTTFRAEEYASLVVLTSDLLRAKETATIICDKNPDLPIHQDEVMVETRLRERWFGQWDGTSDGNYHRVWEDDAIDSSHTIRQVESVEQVMQRTTQCILEWDELLASIHGDRRCMVILAAHGDVLQILQTAYEKMDGRLHRTLPHLETAQLRKLRLAS